MIADPQLDGMEYLYDVIGEMLLEGTELENAYSFLISTGDVDVHPPPGSGSACNAPFDWMTRHRNQSSLQCWRSSAKKMMERDQPLRHPTYYGVNFKIQ